MKIKRFNDSGMEIPGTCIILKNGDKILGVTRKHDHNDWGLPGGKMDPGETPLEAIARETKEETGLEILNVELVDQRIFKNRLVYLFKGDWSGDIEYDREKEGLCDWIDSKKLIDGTFGEYNLAVSKFFI